MNVQSCLGFLETTGGMPCINPMIRPQGNRMKELLDSTPSTNLRCTNLAK